MYRKLYQARYRAQSIISVMWAELLLVGVATYSNYPYGIAWTASASVEHFSFLYTGVQLARLTLGCQVAAPACWPTWPGILWSVDVATLCTPEERCQTQQVWRTMGYIYARYVDTCACMLFGPRPFAEVTYRTPDLEQCTVYGNSTRKIAPIYMRASCPTKFLRTSSMQPSIISHMGQLARMVCNRVIPIPEGIYSLCQYIELKLYKTPVCYAVRN